jgi:primosomal protein N'
MESENCQTCRYRPLECLECGSKDVFEIMFVEGVSEEVSLSFKGIKKVTRGSDAKTS